MPHLDEWHQQIQYTSHMGLVYNVRDGWIGKVNLPNGQIGRIGETFLSADVAKASVERVWRREKLAKEQWEKEIPGPDDYLERF
jgi:hypothetical protein